MPAPPIQSSLDRSQSRRAEDRDRAALFVEMDPDYQRLGVDWPQMQPKAIEELGPSACRRRRL